MPLSYQCYAYDQLAKDQLYAILVMRSQVFVVEQRCFYHDPDGIDMQCHHLLAMEGDQVVGCARIVPPGAKSEYPAIGRYLLLPEYRGKGNGRRFFAECIVRAQMLYPNQTLYIQAQDYLRAFYASFGFKPVGPLYEDAAVLHFDMLLVP